jgi:hypothetical protein
MTGIIEVTRYQTDDGVEHKTLDEAQAHDDVRNLADAIFEGFGRLFSSQAKDLATWLLERYDITPKG